MDRPLPFWILFPLLFILVYLLHITLLRLPYYWDEAGYYIPAAYDFFRSGALIPYSTQANAHPPLLSIYLALWWKASGFTPAVTRTAMCLVAALGLLAVFRLSLLLARKPQVAAATVLLTLIYPIWFAQSTLAHADLFAAAGILWGLVLLFEALGRAGPAKSSRQSEPGRRFPSPMAGAVICFSLAAVAKETAIVTPVAIALWLAWSGWRDKEAGEHGRFRLALLLLLPIAPLAGWYAYFRMRTGYVFGNPAYWSYNAGSTLTAERFFAALGHRLLDLLAHMNMFVPVLCALGALLLPPLLERTGTERRRIPLSAQAILYAVLGANLLFYSAFGGALLARYLLPLYPLVLLLAVSTLRRRVRYWWALIALSAAAFIFALLVNPPYRFAPEDNLSYADVIRLQQSAIRQIQKRFPGTTVLTAWPATDELGKPELGYVKKPIPVVSIENFSQSEVEKAAALRHGDSVVLAFSTKYEPAHKLFDLKWNEALDERYFGFHHDLDPQAIAHLLGGEVVWQGYKKGEWAAVIRLGAAQPAQAGIHEPRPLTSPPGGRLSRQL